MKGRGLVDRWVYRKSDSSAQNLEERPDTEKSVTGNVKLILTPKHVFALEDKNSYQKQGSARHLLQCRGPL